MMHMPLEDMLDRFSSAELSEWIEELKLRHAEQEQREMQRRVQQGVKGGGGTGGGGQVFHFGSDEPIVVDN